MIEHPVEMKLSLSPKVLQHISSNIYRNPSSGFKELASNAFDASATEFTIKFSVNKISNSNYRIDSISVKDNGEGMDLDDLKYIFKNIGNSGKVKDVEYDSIDIFNEKIKDRPIIGRIGIGLFSIATATNNFVIKTKKSGTKAQKASVELADFSRLRTTNFSLENFNAGTVKIEEIEGDSDNDSYTEIIIDHFKTPFLEDIMENFRHSIFYNLEGTDLDNIYEEFLDKITKNDDISKAAGIDRFIFSLTSMLPIEYLPDGPFRKCVHVDHPEVIESIKNRLKSYSFNCYIEFEVIGHEDKVNYRKMKLFRNVLFPLKVDLDKFGPEMLKPNVYVNKRRTSIPNEIKDKVELNLSFYIYHQNKRINTINYRGILYRIYDVGIGSYEYQKFRGFSSTVLNFQTSLEVFLDRGFQSAVNIDRESLYEAAYSYRYLKSYLDYEIKGNLPQDLEEERKSTVPNNQQQLQIDSESHQPISAPQSENVMAEANFREQLKKDFRKPNHNPI